MPTYKEARIAYENTLVTFYRAEAAFLKALDVFEEAEQLEAAQAKGCKGLGLKGDEIPSYEEARIAYEKAHSAFYKADIAVDAAKDVIRGANRVPREAKGTYWLFLHAFEEAARALAKAKAEMKAEAEAEARGHKAPA